MKMVCDCGEVTELVDSSEPSYTEGEGWYKVTKGEIEFNQSHDQVFFNCAACGQKVWIFT